LSLAHLSPLDIAVIAIYFAMVIWIGFYLKKRANTSEEFFMAGREMTAWIAGLSFVSANLGSLELMGWAARRISTASWPRTGTGSAPSRRCSFWAW
jgi:SSS family solute:Na+ symporter